MIIEKQDEEISREKEIEYVQVMNRMQRISSRFSSRSHWSSATCSSSSCFMLKMTRSLYTAS